MNMQIYGMCLVKGVPSKQNSIREVLHLISTVHHFLIIIQLAERSGPVQGNIRFGEVKNYVFLMRYYVYCIGLMPTQYNRASLLLCRCLWCELSPRSEMIKMSLDCSFSLIEAAASESQDFAFI